MFIHPQIRVALPGWVKSLTKLNHFVLALCGILISQSVFAAAWDTPKRTVSLQWDAVAQVSQYEVEIIRVFPKDSNFKLNTRVKRPVFETELPPGEYQMKTRGVTKAGKKTGWSLPTAFYVKKKSITQVYPGISKSFSYEGKDLFSTSFRWKSVKGIKRYKVYVFSSGEKVVKTRITRKSSTTMRLPVGNEYSWQVIGLIDGNEMTEAPSFRPTFKLKGGQLRAPKLWIDSLDSTKGSAVWNWPQGAKTFDMGLYRRNGSKWKKVSLRRKYKKSKWTLPKNLRRGDYRFEVTAKGDLYSNSKLQRVHFKIPFTSETMELARKERRIQGSKWKLDLDYKVSNMDFLREDDVASARFNAIGGVGTVGFSYLPNWKNTEVIGAFGIAAYTITGQNHTFFKSRFDYGKWLGAGKGKIGFFGGNSLSRNSGSGS